ncbi:STAS domain-containing protein [Streptomyces sp. NPDC058291]|uniref:STAS domain-containing protein n=1 Tax=Streptomyces sp. NPDC058291 TaxID=3346427 RepID=UPI0036E38BCE
MSGNEQSDQVTGPGPDRAAVLQYERNGAWVVVAHGDYDLNSIAPLEDALVTAARKHSKVVLDVSALTFADSTFLNLLIRIHRETGMRLAGPPANLQRLLEITGADGVLDVRATVGDAVS